MRKADSTPVLLLMLALAGFARTEALGREGRQARELADALNDGGMHHVLGRVVAVDSFGDERHRVTLADAEVTSGASLHRIPGRVRVSLGAADKAPAMPGDRVLCAARIGEVTGFRNFHGRNMAQELAKERVHVAARVPSGAVYSVDGRADDPVTRLGAWLGRVRRAWTSSISGHLPAAEADMVSSMLFNDRTLLPEASQKAFRDAGTMHLFAVSGMHVAMFAFLLGMALRSLKLSPRTTWTVIAVVILLYVWMIGWVVPAVRAMAMLFAFAAGWWLRREVDSWSALVFAVAVMVAANPLAAWQASFLLSVAGVAGILMVMPVAALFVPSAPRDAHGTWCEGAWRLVRDSVTVTLAATVMVLPLQLHYFGQFNLLSPLANMVAAPLSGVVLAGALSVVISAPLVPAVATVFGGATAAAMKAIHGVSVAAASQEWAIVRTGGLPVWAVMLYYLVIVSGYYVVRRDTPEFAPKSRARLALHLAAAAVVIIFASALARHRSGMRICFLDVGQGDATLVEFPGGETLLIDAGNIQPDTGRAVVLPHLRGLGIRATGNVLATHPDADHIGGLASVIADALPARLFGTAGSTDEDGMAGRVSDLARRHGVRLEVIAGLGEATLGRGARLKVLNPVAHAAALTSATDNDRSVVLRIEYGEFSALLMGDAEKSVEARLISEGMGRADVIKVAHHGSNGATSAAFLSAVEPAVAVISCGRHNRYGHPAKPLLDRLAASDAAVYRTDRDGAVVVESNGKGFSVRRVRPGGM